MLGPIEALVEGRPAGLTAGKQRALLAALLIDAGRTVPVDVLIDRLWGERPPPTAVKNVQVLVSQLRRLLGADAITTDGSGYRLRDEAADVTTFTALLESGRAELAAGDAREAERTLDEALALWRGRPYEDVQYEDFAREEAARLEDLRLDAMEERFQAMLDGGRHVQALPGLRALARAHPLRERVLAELILALYRSGRRAEALEVYDAARRRLADELGIEPGERLRRLHALMLEREGDRSEATRLEAPPRGDRSRQLLMVGGGLLLLAALLAAAMINRGGGGEETALAGVPGDSIGVIDPATRAIVARYAVGATPTSVAGDSDASWALNADAQTISRVDRRTGEVIERSLAGTPADLVFGGGALWVALTDTAQTVYTATLVEVDPDTLRPERSVRLPGTGETGGSVVALAFGNGAVFATAPSGRLVRIDAQSLRLTQGPRLRPDAVAYGEGSVWTVGSGTRLTRLDPQSLTATARFSIPTAAGVTELAVGGGLVWGAEPFSGLLWRIDPSTRPMTGHTIPVGLSASDVAYGAGAVWVASGIDGALIRVDPGSGAVSRVAVGQAPQRVAIAGGQVLVTVAGGGGAAIAGGGSDTHKLATLPSSSCGPVVYGGTGSPDLLIASDFPVTGIFARVTLPMVQTVEYVLRGHSFRAGKFRVGYQPCDDATQQAATYDAGKCEANAKAYAGTKSVVGVIGTLNSGCAEVVLPILNSASDPLALISPGNSYVGLTRTGPGVAADDPGRFQRAGGPTYLRVYPGDNIQYEAEAILAKRLGVSHAYAFAEFPRESYQLTITQGFAIEARRRGIQVTGPASPAAGGDAYMGLARSLQRDGVDGVLIATYGSQRVAALIRALRAVYGRSLPIIVSDSMLFGDFLQQLGRAGQGIYISGAKIEDPKHQLPAEGRQFVRAFSATQPGRVVNAFTPYTAQATELLLAAIGRSDGSRASVLRELRRAEVRNGILGSFSFDANGDMTVNRMPVFRSRAANHPAGPFEVFQLIDIRSEPTG